jgi:hypothetical protein
VAERRDEPAAMQKWLAEAQKARAST